MAWNSLWRKKLVPPSQVEPAHYRSEADILASRLLKPGDNDYRAYVGPPAQFDFMGATQLSLAFALGLREENHFLDIGCGSLRAGRLLIQYLLPDRYYGIEPNKWLWNDIVASEIGNDVLAIKRPTFSDASDFSYGRFGVRFDMMIAQSVFSHTGLDLFETGLANASAVLAERGQFLFTTISEGTRLYSTAAKGMNLTGWFYPECVTYSRDEVIELCRHHGLHAQPIPWFHPRQQWFRAVTDPAFLIADPATAFRNGRILFDDRFPD